MDMATMYDVSKIAYLLSTYIDVVSEHVTK